MDPATALANLAAATINLITELLDGATPEQKQEMWRWYIEDMQRWRRLLKLDPS